MTSRDLSGSRAILIGNGVFTDHENIPRVPASGCVAAMLDLLTSDLCGWPRDRIDLLEDLPNQADLSRNLVRSVRGARDVLLVYYVGHGMLTMRGELVLALRDTEADPEALPYTAMPYGHLARILGGSTAATKLVILDCCYAETANQANFGTQSAGLTDAHPVDGLYFIGASKRLEKAGFPLYGDLTYFTEAFIDTVRTGVPRQPPVADLTLSDIFRALRDKLAASGLPEPADSGIRDARQYPFAVNAAFASPAAVGPEDPARRARLRLLTHAEHAVPEISDSWPGPAGKATALLDIAAAAAPDDAERTRRLTSQAMRLIAAGKIEPYRMVAVVKSLAATSPERAERIAAAIQDSQYRDYALAEAAQVIAATAPGHAERVASIIGVAHTKASALAKVAETVMTFAPEQAEDIARTISVPHIQGNTLIEVAKVIAAGDPHRAETIAVAVVGQASGYQVATAAKVLAEIDPEAAERVARSIADQEDRDKALESVAQAAASRDPQRARDIVSDIATPHHQGWAAYNVACRLVTDALDLAEDVARTIPDSYYRAIALDMLYRRLAETSPDRAARFLAEAEKACQAITDRGHHDYVVGFLAEAMAATDREHALRVANTARDHAGRAEAISRVAVRVAATDPYEAQRIAAMIPEARRQARVLLDAADVATRHEDAGGAGTLLARAKSLAAAVTDYGDRALLLADLAVGLAPIDPDQARRTMDEAEIVGRTIPDDPGLFQADTRDKALVEITRITFRHTSPEVRKVLRDHAERIARAIPGQREQADALTSIAMHTLADDPDRAERAALAITSPERRIEALLQLAAKSASCGARKQGHAS